MHSLELLFHIACMCCAAAERRFVQESYAGDGPNAYACLQSVETEADAVVYDAVRELCSMI